MAPFSGSITNRKVNSIIAIPSGHRDGFTLSRIAAIFFAINLKGS
jgi:hypothetical protein